MLISRSSIGDRKRGGILNLNFECAVEIFLKMENVSLDRNVHELLKNDDGMVEQDQEGNWLIINSETKEIFAVYPNPEVLSFFEIMEVNKDVENEPPHNGDNFTWNRATTWLLIREFHKHKDEYRSPKRKKKDIWQQIKGVFDELGYNVSIDTLDRNLEILKKHIKCKRTSQKKLEEVHATGSIFTNWMKYFFDDLTVNFPETLSSIPSTSALPATSIVLPAVSPELPSSFVVASTPTCTASNISVQEHVPAEADTDSVATPSRRKTSKSTELYNLRRKQLDIEKARVEEIKKLRLAIEENNIIQRDRNEILRQIAGNNSG